MTTNPNEIEAARKVLGIGSDNMLADDWLIKQLAAWPTRVDPECTTNLRFLMESAALSLHLSAASARGVADGYVAVPRGDLATLSFGLRMEQRVSLKYWGDKLLGFLSAAPSSPAATPEVERGWRKPFEESYQVVRQAVKDLERREKIDGHLPPNVFAVYGQAISALMPAMAELDTLRKEAALRTPPAPAKEDKA